MLILALIFQVVAIWTQVTSPELMGQATDCFLVPTGSNPFGSFGVTAGSQTQAAESSCWLAKDPSELSGRQALLSGMVHFDGYTIADPTTATNDQRIEGLVRLIGVLILLFVLGSLPV
jgi:hypothetical protein